MRTEAQIYQSLFDWLKRESGVTVIKANQKGPRPARPYASLNFQVASTRLGNSIDQQSSVQNDADDWVVQTSGMRKAVASINIFGENAIATLAAVRDSLDRPDVIEEFQIAEIGHLDEGSIQDLTALQETAYEERGQLDLTISYVAESEADVGTIEHVEATGSVAGKPVSVKAN